MGEREGKPGDMILGATSDSHVPLISRKRIRLAGYNYAQAGAYFVTIRTQGGECLFGEVFEGQVNLNLLGRIVCEEWERTDLMRERVVLDSFIVMPNHLHGIIALCDVPEAGTRQRAPTMETFGRPVSDSLPTIVRGVKAAVTERINRKTGTPGRRVWQRGFYEHVIRDEVGLYRIRQYIEQNPLAWSVNREEPDGFGVLV